MSNGLKYNPYDPTTAGKGRSYMEHPKPPFTDGQSPYSDWEEVDNKPSLRVEIFPNSVILNDDDDPSIMEKVVPLEEWLLSQRISPTPHVVEKDYR